MQKAVSDDFTLPYTHGTMSLVISDEQTRAISDDFTPSETERNRSVAIVRKALNTITPVSR